MARAERTTVKAELKVPKVPHCAPTSTTVTTERIRPPVNPIRSPKKQIAESTTKIAATNRTTVGR